MKNLVDIQQWSDEKKEKLQSVIAIIEQNFNEEQIERLEIFANTLVKMDNDLSILKKYGVTYDLNLVAGAIRDFVLGKPIGDMDICLSIPCIKGYKGYLTQAELNQNNINLQELWKQYFPLEEVFLNDKNVGNLIHALVGKKYNGELYLSTEGEVDNYNNISIISIIKIKNEAFKLPIDLIVTDKRVEDFCNTFSFDICKGYLEYNKEFINTLKEEGHIAISKHITLMPFMLKDIENQTLTINYRHLNKKELDYYMNKHYVKMKKKFPDYKLEGRTHTTGIPNSALVEAKNMDRVMEHYKLQNNLPEFSEVVIPKLKI